MGISVSVIEEAVSADREELNVEAGEIAVGGVRRLWAGGLV